MAKRHCTSRVFICIICRCPVVVVVAVVLCDPCHGSSLNVINNKVKPKKKHQDADGLRSPVLESFALVVT